MLGGSDTKAGVSRATNLLHLSDSLNQEMQKRFGDVGILLEDDHPEEPRSFSDEEGDEYDDEEDIPISGEEDGSYEEEGSSIMEQDSIQEL